MAMHSESAVDRVGHVVDKYEIVALIGRGGMGSVYEAVHQTLGKRVALKFVEGVVQDSFARFRREAQAASRVESPYIVEMFDSGTAGDGTPYLVMELLRGEDLAHRIRRLGRLDVPKALEITAQILRGLHRAHEVGIIHRDLKPDNIVLVDVDGHSDLVKIIDFGISKVRSGTLDKSTTITQEGTLLGTPLYMSPEQIQTLTDIDERTDLYSAGAILFECLTGRTPHTGSSYEQVIVNICIKDSDDVRTHTPAISGDLAMVLRRALARDRGERFQTALDFLEALVKVSDGALDKSYLAMSGSRGNRKPLGPGRTVSLSAVSTVATDSGSPGHRMRSRVVYGGVGALAIGTGALLAWLLSSPATIPPSNLHLGAAHVSTLPRSTLPRHPQQPVSQAPSATRPQASAAASSHPSANPSPNPKPTDVGRGVPLRNSSTAAASAGAPALSPSVRSGWDSPLKLQEE